MSEGLAKLGTSASGLGVAVSNQVLLIDQAVMVLDQLGPTLSTSSGRCLRRKASSVISAETSTW